MKKIYSILFLLLFSLSFASSNVIVNPIITQTYPNFYQSLTVQNFTSSSTGFGYGTVSINNNILTVSFGGNWTPGKQLNTTTPVVNFGFPNLLPNVTLGSISYSSAVAISTGYSIKIQNNTLMIYCNGTPPMLTSCYLNVSIDLSCVNQNGEIMAMQNWYLDNDLDGLGDPANYVTQCYSPNGNYVENNLDLCPLLYGSMENCSQITNTDSNGKNYIKNKQYKINTTNTITNPSITDAFQNITYFDGLGRPIQKINHRQSESGNDIITHIEYDTFGREIKNYLPIVNGQTLDFHNIDASTVGAFYSTPTIPTMEPTANPYSENLFESSPLNRLLKQAAPGDDWHMGNGHEIKFDYQTNLANDAVRLFKATTTWNVSLGLYDISLSDNGFYIENDLYKYVIKNENWTNGNLNTTQEFKDKSGRIILKRAFANDQNGAIIPHDTYYVYDEYGNLTYVIPPKATGNIASVLSELCYQYKFDWRNRLVEKKIPGRQWEYIVYDKLDRVVMTGPTRPPLTDLSYDGWLINKYDVFNRVVVTGWMTTTASGITSNVRKARQLERDNPTSIVNETRLSTGNMTPAGTGNSVNPAYSYSNVCLPTSGYYILGVNYYDDYNYVTEAPSIPTDILGQPVFYNYNVRPIGLLTGKWTKVLSTAASNRREFRYQLYDYKGRVLRDLVKNHENSPGGYTQVDSKFDFEGKKEYSVTLHKRINSESGVTITDYYTYTNQSRLFSHTQKINTMAIQLIAENSYDDLGNLISKKVGNTANSPLQKVDYRYNIRGWLSSINHDASNNAFLNNAENDLFSFKINYNSVQNETNYIGKPQFNGNISEIYWKTANDFELRKYGYFYDGLNRLTDAIYLKPGNCSPEPSTYNERISYDMNGNIMTLKRNGGLDGVLPEQEIDNLTYTYANNNQSNRLIGVSDVYANAANGFIDGTNTGDDFTYDAYGNLKTDANKGITEITYNHLNLPTKITFGTTGNITYIYNAEGKKVEKTIKEGTIETNTKYLEAFQYVKNVLTFFPHPEGYVSKTSSNYNYAFNYTDHLGNVRLTYSDIDKDGILETEEEVIDCPGGGPNCITYFRSCILKENNYYPFGLQHEGYNQDQGQQVDYKYRYNGQEWQDELGLNMTAMDYRQYDNMLGRFNGIDALAELMPNLTPYHFGFSNPIHWGDPSGLSPSGTQSVFEVGKALFENSGAGRTNWLNGGDGFWSITASSSGNGGVYDSNTGVFTHMALLPEAVIARGVREGSERFFNILKGHTYWKSPFYSQWRSKEFGRQMDDFQSDLDWLGTADPTGIIDGINAVTYFVRGQRTNALVAAVAILPFGDAAKFAKLQKHHIIPRAVFRDADVAIKNAMNLNAGNNLKKLPSGFHGNHPQYNSYVASQLNALDNVTPGSIQNLQKSLNSMINDAYDNYKITGENLNDYFRKINGN